MKQRIRAAGIVEMGGKLLLVEHQDGKGNRWWIPPGGGLEDVDVTILDCVRREIHEETGLHVKVGNLRYIREFIDRTNDTRHMELFYQAEVLNDGKADTSVLGPTLFDPMIKSVKWLGRDEIRHLTVFPDILKDGYWDSKAEEQPKYLGVSIESGD